MDGRDPLALLSGWEPSAPRLIWYGDDGERVELSGRVLTNWVVKAANLLVDLGADDGARVHLDLPAHWRLLVWALGARAAGADLTVRDDAADGAAADLVVTDRPDRWDGVGPDLVAVPLPALARAWPEPLPAGAVDGAAELMGQPDVPVFAAAPRPGSDPVTGRRLAIATAPAALLEHAWGVWETGGSIVVVTPRDTDGVAAISAQEGADPLPD